jgi:uncharacterized BrkB/YihY/UPF0761 family membrane protein
MMKRLIYTILGLLSFLMAAAGLLVGVAYFCYEDCASYTFWTYPGNRAYFVFVMGLLFFLLFVYLERRERRSKRAAL